MNSASDTRVVGGNELPKGWALARLGEICFAPQYGWTTKSIKGEAGLKLLRTSDISGGEVDWGNVPVCEKEPEDRRKYILSKGDILVSRAGSVGISLLIEDCPEAVFASYLIRLRPIPPLSPGFVSYFMRSPFYWEGIAERSIGITIPNVNATKLKSLHVPLPPLAEQKRIVSKLEDLLTCVAAVRERLENVPAIMKRFRQSVLTAACSGRLTEDWREENRDVEYADRLLKRLKEKRIQLKLRSSNRVIDTENIGMPETKLDDSWVWCRLGDIADVRIGGTPSRKVREYWGGNIAWVSSGEVANCPINATREHITEVGLDNSSAKVYPKGSVLIAMIGEGKTRGQAAILRIDACTNQNVAGLVFDGGNIQPEYVWYWAISEYEKNRDVGRGGSQPALNSKKVRALPIPLPPFLEQREIVRRVEALFALADKVEERVARARASADRLEHAILAKAFRGELVPTEAELARRDGRDYEPAEELLERIRGERGQR
jgi:type I restriction enzyme S subunit